MRSGYRDFKILYIAAAITFVDHNLKPCTYLPQVCCGNDGSGVESIVVGM